VIVLAASVEQRDKAVLGDEAEDEAEDEGVGRKEVVVGTW
jgi:hypothetical protein